MSFDSEAVEQNPFKLPPPNTGKVVTAIVFIVGVAAVAISECMHPITGAWRWPTATAAKVPTNAPQAPAKPPNAEERGENLQREAIAEILKGLERDAPTEKERQLEQFWRVGVYRLGINPGLVREEIDTLLIREDFLGDLSPEQQKILTELALIDPQESARIHKDYKRRLANCAKPR